MADTARHPDGRDDADKPHRHAVPSGRLPTLRVCLAAAGGGHLAELLRIRLAYADLSHFFVINRTLGRSRKPPGRVYWVADYGAGCLPRRAWSLISLVIDSVRIYRLERPNALVTTGPLTGLPLALLIRARGGRVLFIECSAQVTRPSRSGRLFTHVAHRFFIQWPALQNPYPRAEYGGLLL